MNIFVHGPEASARMEIINILLLYPYIKIYYFEDFENFSELLMAKLRLCGFK